MPAFTAFKTLSLRTPPSRVVFWRCNGKVSAQSRFGSNFTLGAAAIRAGHGHVLFFLRRSLHGRFPNSPSRLFAHPLPPVARPASDSADDSSVERDIYLASGLAVAFVLCGLALALRAVRPRTRRADKKDHVSWTLSSRCGSHRQAGEKVMISSCSSVHVWSIETVTIWMAQS